MAITIARRTLVNWKSLGHVRVEESSPYSEQHRRRVEKAGQLPAAATLYVDVERQLQHIGLFVSPTPIGSHGCPCGVCVCVCV